MTYDVNITVTECYTVAVQADSEEEATSKAITMLTNNDAGIPTRYVDAEVDCEYDDEEEDD